MRKLTILLTALVLCIAFGVRAQNTIGGTPPSFIYEDVSSDFVEVLDLKVPNLEQIKKEDIKNEELGKTYRYAVGVNVDMGIDNTGTWSYLPDGSKIWRVTLKCDGALSLGVYYNQFWLPKGSRLYVYDNDKRQVLGAYTHANNEEHGLFVNQMIYSDEITLEYYKPIDVEENAIINIDQVSYAYRGVESPYQTKWTEPSQSCEINVACSQGDNWRDQIDGVARISIKIGGSYFWCTGSLVNNAAWDCKNYFLTADHCAKDGSYASAADMNQWVFHFNYQSSTCTTPTNQPLSRVATGCQLRGHGGTSGSDFYLVELNNSPMNFQPYYNGWNRNNVTSSSGVGIHHPAGSIKKISTYSTTTSSGTWMASAQTHWWLKWSEGVSEGGSSGSPLFNSNKQIIGTLTGGASACTVGGAGPGTGPNESDAYGKFSYHWANNGSYDIYKLQPRLDPSETGLTSLPGFYCNVGVEDNNISDLNIFSYPNPTTGVFTVEIPKTYTNELVNINVYDVLGQMVWNNTANTSQQKFEIDLSGNTAGVYYVNVAIGDKVATKKITLTE